MKLCGIKSAVSCLATSAKAAVRRQKLCQRHIFWRRYPWAKAHGLRTRKLTSLAALLIVFCVLGTFNHSKVFAATDPNPNLGAGTGAASGTTAAGTNPTTTTTGTGTGTGTTSASQKTKDDGSVGNDCADKNVNKCLQNDKFISILKKIVNFLSAGVGVVVIFAIIIGGIRYTVAGDDAGAVTAAKKQIYNAILALIAFGLTWAFLQWLIPGGIL